MSTGTYRDPALLESGAGGWLLRRSTWRPSAVFAVLLGDFALLGVTIGVQGVLWVSLMSAVGAGKAAFGTAQLAAPLILHRPAPYGWALRAALSTVGLSGLGILWLARGVNE